MQSGQDFLCLRFFAVEKSPLAEADLSVCRFPAKGIPALGKSGVPVRLCSAATTSPDLTAQLRGITRDHDLIFLLLRAKYWIAYRACVSGRRPVGRYAWSRGAAFELQLRDVLNNIATEIVRAVSVSDRSNEAGRKREC